LTCIPYYILFFRPPHFHTFYFFDNTEVINTEIFFHTFYFVNTKFKFWKLSLIVIANMFLKNSELL